MTIADKVLVTSGRQGASEVGRSIASMLGPLLAHARAGSGPAPLLWGTRPVAELDPIALYAAATALGLEAAIWLQPTLGRSFVGIGRAWAVEHGGPGRFAQAASAWQAVLAGAIGSGTGGAAHAGVAADAWEGGPILLGGLGFSGREPALDDPWAAYGPSSLVLPTFLVARRDAGTFLTVAAGPEQAVDLDPEHLEGVWADLVRRTGAQAQPAADGLPGTRARRDITEMGSFPSHAAWDRIVGLFAGAVGRGRIDKVVLARRVAYRAGTDFDVVGALRHLALTAPESTTFAFGRPGSTFMGATPERLVRTAGYAFETVAIAGSTARGHGADEDERLAAALLASEKDREEHAVVVEALRTSLAPIVEHLHVADAPGILPLKHVQHLVTAITGTLREEQGLLALAERLHPTPAVGGAPRDVALEMIAEHENADRGWYAGPIGWLGADGDGELMVALRCGLVVGAEATLFAGCGIVADSDPAREWEESRLKLRTMRQALGLPADQT